MDSKNKFVSFLNTDLASIIPPELVGEIGQRFFWDFHLDKDITYDDLFKLSPYISYLDLGWNQKIVSLPLDLTNLQYLYLGYTNTIVALPDQMSLPNLQTLSLGSNNTIGSLPPDLPNLQRLGLGNNDAIVALSPNLPNLRVLDLGDNEKIVALPPDLPNLQYLNLSNNHKIDEDTLRTRYPNLHIMRY